MLVMCWGIVESSPSVTEVLKPGALVASMGQVVVVEDVVTIQLSLTNLFNLSPSLKFLKDQLRVIKTHLAVVRDSKALTATMTKMVKLQTRRLEELHDSFDDTVNNLPTLSEDVRRTAHTHRVKRGLTTHTHRVKRGLFNFAGILSKTLFGTATAADVDALGKKLQIVTKAVIKQNRRVEQTYQGLKVINDQVMNLIDFAKELGKSVNDINQRLPTMESLLVIGKYLHATETYLTKKGEDEF